MELLPKNVVVNPKTGLATFLPYVQIPDGKSTTPSLCFTSSPTSGFSLGAGNSVVYIKGGTSQGELIGSSGSVNITTTGTVTAASFIPTSGTVPTNGVYLPAANSVAISTNGTGRLFVDATGRVGIGTSAPSALLHARGNASAPAAIIHLQPDNNTVSNFITFRNATDATRGYIEYNYASDYLAFASANAERFRCDSSGRLLVGTSTSAAQAKLIVQGFTADSAGFGLAQLQIGSTTPANGAALGRLDFSDSAGYQAAWIRADRDGGTWTSGTSHPGRLVFSTTADGAASPTERMRISQSGMCSINTTLAENSAYFDGKLRVLNSGTGASFGTTGAAGAPVVSQWHQATTGDNLFTAFGTEAAFTLRGSIDYNRAAGQVRYNVTSDRRLKSDIQPAASALDTLSAIQVRAYKWTETDYQVSHGFIAQELHESVPDAVKVGDSDEEVTNPWAVDNAKLVPLLTKALQEAIGEIESLKARVAALEAS